MFTYMLVHFLFRNVFHVMFSVSMLIFFFVLWVLLSYILICLLVHYTELRLRLAYKFPSYCEHLSLVKRFR